MNVCFSMSWVDSWCERKRIGRERTSSNADESSADYVPKNTLWWRFENLGSLSNAYSQADHQFAKSIGNFEADCKYFKFWKFVCAYRLDNILPSRNLKKLPDLLDVRSDATFALLGFSWLDPLQCLLKWLELVVVSK